jgi:hypothetical protein
MKRNLAAAAVLATALSTVLSTTASTAADATAADATAARHHAGHLAGPVDRAGSYRVVATVKDTEPMVKDKVRIKATVSPAAPGATVTLQVKYQDQKAWKTLDRARLSAAGKARFTDRVSSVRARKYRVVKAADSRHGAGSGQTAKVTVFGWRALGSITAINAQYLYPQGSVTINGTAYPDSIVGSTGSTTQPGTISFNLNRDCKQLEAVYGISDSSAGNGSATLTVTADGVVRHTAPYALTQAQRVVTDVTGVFRLTISAAPIGGIPAVGSPKVLCSF